MSIFNKKIFGIHPPAFGLDLSDLSIKIAQLKKEKGGLVLSCYGREEIPEKIIEKGEIRKTEELIQLIKKALKEVKGLALSTKQCVVSLPETESFIQMIQMPRLKKEELKEAIKWEIENNIPLSIEEVYFDWQIIEPLKESGEHYDVLVGALGKKCVDPYLEVLKAAGLQPISFEIESMATARSLIKDSFSLNPVMIVDLGAMRSSFIIFSGRTIHFTASSPISNNYLIEEIAKKMDISLAEAKRLKFEVGLDRNKSEDVFNAIQPALGELVGQIKKYIDFYHTHGLAGHFQNPGVSKVLLCGGGANLKGLASFISKELRFDVELGNPWVNILQSAPEKIPELPYEQSIGYATVLGLALRGVGAVDLPL